MIYFRLLFVFSLVTCTCAEGGDPSLMVYNGNEAKEGMFPSIGMVKLEDETYTYQCGATLINREWAVTAAHCFDDEETGKLLNLRSKSVIFGDIQPKATNPSQWRQISSFNYIIHKRYNGKKYPYDIALLHLDRNLSTTKYVSPVNISTSSHETQTYNNCQVAGWGIYAGDSLSSKLLYANLSLTKSSVCRKKHGLMNFTMSTMLCAGSTTSDACKGDSGGPLYCINKESSRRELVGIVSYGDPTCEPSTTGVYTRVSAFQKWINSRGTKYSVPPWIPIVSVIAGLILIAIIVMVVVKASSRRSGYASV